MTFACRNFDPDSGTCRKLGGECIPGRTGCVLDGQVKLSDALQKRVAESDGGQPPPEP